MSTLMSLVPEDARCSPPTTLANQSTVTVLLAGPAPRVVESVPVAPPRPLPTRPTRGQVRVLVAMVSLVVVHSTAVALYVLGG